MAGGDEMHYLVEFIRELNEGRAWGRLIVTFQDGVPAFGVLETTFKFDEKVKLDGPKVVGLLMNSQQGG